MGKNREYLDDIKKPGFFRKIQLWWHFEGQFIVKNTKNGINNIIYWFPIIWKDRNYDHSYIYNILKHKLKYQSNYIKSKDRFTSSEQSVRRMNICVSLINKVQDDYYSMEYTNYFKEKHWFEKIENTEYSTWESEPVWEKFDDYIKRYPLIHKRVLNGEGPFKLEGSDYEIKKSVVMNIGHINQKRAHKLLFKILEENIERWWN
jgi:hypothetical protein